MSTVDDGVATLELRAVPKAFGSVVALRSRNRRVRPGSIHALVGENGAGKSTLIKIAAGVHRRDAGEMLLGGESVDFGSTAESKAAGIAVISQEPTLFPDLSVTENIFMGRQILGSGRRIDRHAMYAEAERLFTGLGVDLDPRRPALGLSIADQQIIEIATAISLDARFLIMDEPTAALSGVEVERLFTVARRLRDEGERSSSSHTSSDVATDDACLLPAPGAARSPRGVHGAPCGRLARDASGAAGHRVAQLLTVPAR